MAMPSSSSNHLPNVWSDFYQSSGDVLRSSSDEVAATAMFAADQISTTTTSSNHLPSRSSSSYAFQGEAAPPHHQGHLQHQQLLLMNPEGRVAKPARRRSRASKRTPTPVLNTDTKNFRAMVQQFTGGPHPHNAMMTSNSNSNNPTMPSLLTPGGFMIPSGYHLSFQQPPQQQQQQNRPVFSHNISSNNNSSVVLGGYGNYLTSSSSGSGNDHNASGPAAAGDRDSTSSFLFR